MWLFVIFYFFYIIYKIIMVIKSATQITKRKNIMFNIFEVLQDIAVFFLLLFYAMESIGVGWYLSVFIMILCNILKRIQKTRTR